MSNYSKRKILESRRDMVLGRSTKLLTGGCMQLSKAVRYETSTMMDDKLMFSAQWWMCIGISTMLFMLNGICTYVLYSVSGGHIFCNHVLSRCGGG